MTDHGLRWSQPIDFTDHAASRARGYLGRFDEEQLRAEVRAAILTDRVSDCVPAWTRPSGRDRRSDGHDPDTLYVWDPLHTRCWAVRLQYGVIQVRTLLLNHALERDLADDRRVRAGMRRV